MNGRQLAFAYGDWCQARQVWTVWGRSHYSALNDLEREAVRRRVYDWGISKPTSTNWFWGWTCKPLATVNTRWLWANIGRPGKESSVITVHVLHSSKDIDRLTAAMTEYQRQGAYEKLSKCNMENCQSPWAFRLQISWKVEVKKFNSLPHWGWTRRLQKIVSSVLTGLYLYPTIWCQGRGRN